MMKKVITALICLSTFVLCVFLNGQLNIGSYFPPLGKILFPKTGLWQNAETSSKKVKLKHALLKEQVEIFFDEREVPHIYAQNLNDALFAQGYLEAKNRLFQMEVQAKSAAGRLSELFGERTKALDISSREQGYERAAKRAVELWRTDEDFDMVESYLAGINLYISSLKKKNYPFEYKLLNIHPQEWEVLELALIKKSMDRMLCGRSKDIENSNLRMSLGDSLFYDLFPGRNPYDRPIIPEETAFDFEAQYDPFDVSLNIIDTFSNQLKEDKIGGLGSNNWAVHGSRSTTGFPILANDPHLALSLPSIWYELLISTPEFIARGVSIPGAPGIMIGFNEDIAWGTTNSGHDVKDYYQLKYIDSEKGIYEIDGKQKTLEQVSEVIKVKSGKDTTITVLYSDWGPINYLSKQRDKDLSLSWMPNQVLSKAGYKPFVSILNSKTYDDFITSMNDFGFPAQNFIAASKHGDIGIRVTGTLAAKQNNDGAFVKDGSRSSAGLDKFIPRDQLPQAKNPPKGYLASANQNSTDEDYPYYYTASRFENFRGRRINQLLDNGKVMTPQEVGSYQHDTHSIKAEEALSLFLEAINGIELNETQKRYQTVLKKWDYRYEPEQKAPVIFDKWYRSFYFSVYDEIVSIRKRMPAAYPADWRTIELIKHNPEHIIFDLKETDEVEHAKDIIIRSFKEITDTEAPLKTLAAHKNFSIPHIARIDGLGTKQLNVGGTGNALNAISGRAAPSWRMLVALGDSIEAYGVFPGGQSGNPNSKYYRTDVEKWVDGEYNKLELTKRDQFKSSTNSITLNPSSNE